jgi:hypothetical protein
MRSFDGVGSFEGKQLVVNFYATQVNAEVMLGSDFV